MRAADLLGRGGKAAPRLPADAVLLFQRGALHGAARLLRPVRRHSLPGELYVTRGSDSSAAVLLHPGAGAPSAVIALELLVASGVKRLVAIGMAGGLQPSLQPGDLVLCERAIRQDGVSDHYLPPGEYVLPSSGLSDALWQILQNGPAPACRGGSWSCAAPLRETYESAARHAAAGTLVVEMEAAALFAAGERLGIQAAALFAVADGMAESGGQLAWRMDFDPKIVQASLQAALLAALQAFRLQPHPGGA